MLSPFKIRTAITTLLTALAATGLILGNISADSSFTASFDGAPSGPLPFGEVNDLANWDVQVHSRDVSSYYQLPEINAQHGADCSGPPETHTHTNTSYEASVFQCNNHVMTAINGAAGYAEIMLTPDEMVDWSSGEATVSWEMSTQRLSLRDWVDLWITPFEDNKALPLQEGFPDLTGPPANAVHIRMEQFNGESNFVGDIYANGQAVGIPSAWWETIPAGTTSATVRERFELRISSGHIYFGMPGRNLVWMDTGVSIPFTRGVVQFGHHSYTPEKDGAGVPGTWHWDNFSISPAVPFTMIKADRRYTNGGTVNFASPAPANSYLRFAGNGYIEINDGSGWRFASPQSAGDGFVQASYFIPVPAGTQSVQFRFSQHGSWFAGPYIAQDFAIWSR